MIAFDFDKTLKIEKDIIEHSKEFFSLDKYNEKLIEKLQTVRKLGIVVFINTGRSYSSFKKENIFPYDYLACNNGSELYNESDNLIFSQSFKEVDINFLSNYNYTFNCNVKEYFPNKLKSKSFLTSVSIINDNIKEFKYLVSNLKKNLRFVKVCYKFPKIRLVNKDTNKFKIVEHFAKLKQINLSEICAIGDDDNDYEMLKELRGASLQWQSNKIKTLNLKTYDNLIEYLSDIVGV